MLKCSSIRVLSLEYSVGSGYFYCEGWVGAFGVVNGLL